MKRKELIIIVSSMLLCVMFSYGQRGNYTNDYSSSRYNNGSRNGYTSYTTGYSSHNGVRRNIRNSRYNDLSRYYRIMNARDRRTLRTLERRLDARIRLAYRDDNRISRSERRSINRIENDIDELLYRYDRRNQYCR